jgi:hypothetical protein
VNRETIGIVFGVIIIIELLCYIFLAPAFEVRDKYAFVYDGHKTLVSHYFNFVEERNERYKIIIGTTILVGFLVTFSKRKSPLSEG